ncbi:two-component regulator propeller domain-containing protein [Flammeovirga sp. OC4]|uniref:two-component regulator propeller domain-containing protein n=1 Tax=Flammeovirga sp. OC4 TaxID=1382345 RepID=UPI0005C6FA2D|nr:two-component regulator propeller domain-containing protein [Flammeovirga sp. OC4]
MYKTGQLLLITIYLIIFVTPLKIYGQFPEKTSYNFERLSIQDGLSHVHVRDIYQDQKGFMWFATESGLNRYDGYNFRNYKKSSKNENTLNSDYINCIIEDDNGILWVGNSGGIDYYNREKDCFQRVIHQKLVDIKDIKLLKPGYFLIGGLKGLYLFDIQKKEVVKSLFGKHVTNLLISKENEIWVGTKNDGVYVLNTSGITQRVYKSSNLGGLTNDHIEVIHQDQNGKIRVGTDGGGLFELNHNTKKFQHVSLATNVIWDILEVNDRIWLGSSSHGVIVLNPQNNAHDYIQNKVNDPNSLSENHILRFFKDNSSNIWIGGFRKGLNYCDAQTNAFSLISKDRGGYELLTNNSVMSFYEDQQKIYFGTDGGGLNVFDKRSKRMSVLNYDAGNPKSVSSNSILSITKGKDKRLWLGTWAGGLSVFDPIKETFKNYLHDPSQIASIPNNNIWKVYEDSKGNFWMIAHDEGLVMFNPKTNTTSKSILPITGNQSSNVFFNIFESSQQELYFNSYYGLYVYNLNTKELRFFVPNDADSTSIGGAVPTQVIETKEGEIWVSTSNGLSNFDSKKGVFKTYGTKEGLVSPEIRALVQDEEGYIWVSAKNNIARFDPKTKTFVNYLGTSLSQDGEFNKGSVFKLTNGKLLFGNSSGATLFDPLDVKKNTIAPPVVFTNFQLFNEKVNLEEEGSPLTDVIEETEQIILTYEQSVFSIDFAALNYTHSERNQYKYKLEGFDNQWRDGNRRTATYTNLDAGSYTFKVIASNNHNVWNEEGTSIRIIILPPWWKTIWFRLFVLFSMIGAFISFYKYRTKKLIKEQRKLELIVQERTEEVVAQNEELSEQQKEITKQNEALQLQKNEITVQNEELVQQQEEILAQRNYIEEKNEVLQTQNETLKSQHNHITNSVRYAQTIQTAVLPSDDYLATVFDEYFLIYKAKDIVAGDFYWVGQSNGSLLIAVIDCTGHGVPGAFMSMIGSASFNYIINELKIDDPKEILERLHQRVRKALKQDTSANTDGMDICLCKITPQGNKNKIVFAGAKRPLYYFSRADEELHIINGSKKAIGGVQRKGREFENNEIMLDKNTVIYLTTDGYIDQNNTQRKKIGRIMFENLLKSVGRLPLKTQKEQLNQLLELHQGKEDQRDDITIMGILI